MIYMRMMGAVAALALGLTASGQETSHWRVVDFVDEWEEKTGEKGVASGNVALGTGGLSRHRCSLTIGDDWSRLQCTYINLSGGYDDKHWLAVRVGGNEAFTLEVEEAGGGQHKLYFREKSHGKLMNYLRGEPETSQLMIRLNYYSEGATLVKFKLQGLANAMKSAGLWTD